MNDYIKREDALECVTYDEEYTTEQIKGLPSADVVPVVMCKDCKHDISSQFDTEARCNLWGCLKPKRGFCDAGKRREE